MNTDNNALKTFTLYWNNGIYNTITSDKIQNAIAKSLITLPVLKGICVNLDFYETNGFNNCWMWNVTSRTWHATEDN